MDRREGSDLPAPGEIRPGGQRERKRERERGRERAALGGSGLGFKETERERSVYRGEKCLESKCWVSAAVLLPPRLRQNH